MDKLLQHRSFEKPRYMNFTRELCCSWDLLFYCVKSRWTQGRIVQWIIGQFTQTESNYNGVSVPPHQVFPYSCECSTQQFNIEVEVLEVGVRAVLFPRGTLKTRFTHMPSFCERELRYGEPGVVSSEISIGREETLAGGNGAAYICLDGS